MEQVSCNSVELPPISLCSVPTPNSFLIGDILSNGVLAYGARNTVHFWSYRTHLDSYELVYQGGQRVCNAAGVDERVVALSAAHRLPSSDTHPVIYCTAGRYGDIQLWEYKAWSPTAEVVHTSAATLELSWLTGFDNSMGSQPSCVACYPFSAPEERLPNVLVITDNGCMVVWRPERLELRPRLLRVENCERRALVCAWSPHTAWLAAVGYKAGLLIVFRFVEDGGYCIVHRLDHSHLGDVTGVAWNPQDLDKGSDALSEFYYDLASVGTDFTVSLWHLGEYGGNVQSIKQQISERFNSDNNFWQQLIWLAPSSKHPNSEAATSRLYISTRCGDVVLWNNPSNLSSKQCCPVRMVLNAASVLNLRDSSRIQSRFFVCFHSRFGHLFTIDSEQFLSLWTLNDLKMEEMASCPLIAGFVLAAAWSSPRWTNGPQLALACGDNTIRVWRPYQNNGENRYALTILSRDVTGQVTSVAWHAHDFILAFATENGAVGLIHMSPSGMPFLTELSRSTHPGPVYSLTWAPRCPPKYGESFVGCGRKFLYSVGGGCLLRHDVKDMKCRLRASRTAFDLGSWFKGEKRTDAAANHTSNRVLDYPTELAWREDYALLALGGRLGCVEIRSTNTAQINVLCYLNLSQVGSITVLRWHLKSARRDWLAVAAKYSDMFVFDLSHLMPAAAAPALPSMVHEGMCKAKFSCHSKHIVQLAWNPHVDTQLLSCSLDGTAQVCHFNAALDNSCGGQCVANFRGHTGRLYCVVWSQLEKDLCYSGGEDCCLLAWRPSQQIRGLSPAKPSTGLVEDQHTSSSLCMRIDDDMDVSNDEQSSADVQETEETTSSVDDTNSLASCLEALKRFAKDYHEVIMKSLWSTADNANSNSSTPNIHALDQHFRQHQWRLSRIERISTTTRSILAALDANIRGVTRAPKAWELQPCSVAKLLHLLQQQQHPSAHRLLVLNRLLDLVRILAASCCVSSSYSDEITQLELRVEALRLPVAAALNLLPNARLKPDDVCVKPVLRLKADKDEERLTNEDSVTDPAHVGLNLLAPDLREELARVLPPDRVKELIMKAAAADAFQSQDFDSIQSDLNWQTTSSNATRMDMDLREALLRKRLLINAEIHQRQLYKEPVTTTNVSLPPLAPAPFYFDSCAAFNPFNWNGGSVSINDNDYWNDKKKLMDVDLRSLVPIQVQQQQVQQNRVRQLTNVQLVPSNTSSYSQQDFLLAAKQTLPIAKKKRKATRIEQRHRRMRLQAEKRACAVSGVGTERHVIDVPCDVGAGTTHEGKNL